MFPVLLHFVMVLHVTAPCTCSTCHVHPQHLSCAPSAPAPAKGELIFCCTFPNLLIFNVILHGHFTAYDVRSKMMLTFMLEIQSQFGEQTQQLHLQTIFEFCVSDIIACVVGAS